MRIADQLEPLWQAIEQHLQSPPDDEFDRITAIDAFNAAVQQRLGLIAESAGTKQSVLANEFAPNSQRLYWFHTAQGTPIHYLRQTARFASISPADWHSKPLTMDRSRQDPSERWQAIQQLPPVTLGLDPRIE